MANPEHLALLQQGVEAWNNWRREHRRIKPDLDHAQLENLYLNNINLRDASLRGAHLSHMSLLDAHLTRADFSGATLKGTPFPAATCFLIYEEHDQKFASQLHADLQHAGVRCWLACVDYEENDGMMPLGMGLQQITIYGLLVSTQNYIKTEFLPWRSTILIHTNFPQQEIHLWIRMDHYRNRYISIRNCNILLRLVVDVKWRLFRAVANGDEKQIG